METALLAHMPEAEAEASLLGKALRAHCSSGKHKTQTVTMSIKGKEAMAGEDEDKSDL